MSSRASQIAQISPGVFECVPVNIRQIRDRFTQAAGLVQCLLFPENHWQEPIVGRDVTGERFGCIGLFHLGPGAVCPSVPSMPSPSSLPPQSRSADVLFFWLTRWFARPPAKPSPPEPTGPMRQEQAPRPASFVEPAPDGSCFEVSIEESSRGLVVRCRGNAGIRATRLLADVLTQLSAKRPPLVTLDLRELRSISVLVLGVLAAYRRGVVRAGGRVEVDAIPQVKDALARAGLFDPVVGIEDASRPAPQPEPTSVNGSVLHRQVDAQCTKEDPNHDPLSQSCGPRAHARRDLA